MIVVLFVFATSLLLSLLLTHRVRSLGHSLGILDHPDGKRKVHAEPVPRIGGMGIFLAAATTAGLGLLVGAKGLPIDEQLSRQLLALAAGGAGIFLIGLWDDVRRLSARTKFVAEALIAAAVFVGGVRVDLISFGADATFSFPHWISLPITVLWLVGISNAFNLLDGSDGIAGGAALFALSTMAVISMLSGNDLSAAMCFILAGATLGFLFFNFPPASIFLGDSGSLFLGFMLGGMAVITMQKAPTLVAVAVPLVAFGLPILDTGLAVMRRIIKGKNPFHPDRGHIHHRLRDLGHSPRTIALLVYAICAGFSLLSLILFRDSGGASGVVLVLAGGIAVVTVQRLRIPEFLELGNIAQWGPARRRIVERNLRVREAVERLEKADSGEEILSALEHAFSDGEFCRLEMWLEPETGDCLTELDGVRGSEDGVFFRKDLKPRANGDEHGLWEVRLPLTRRGRGQLGRLSLFRELDGTRLYTDVSLVGRALEPVLIEGLEACREDRQESETEGTNGKGLGTLVKVVG